MLGFNSGLSRPGNARPFIRVGAPIGVVAGELSGRMRKIVRDYAGSGGRVFIDSGAFTAYTRGRSIDFDNVLEVYAEIAFGCAQPENIDIVAPDVLGDQQATLSLLRKYAYRIVQLADIGVSILVPFQAGRLSDVALFGAVDESLGFLVDFVPALPFNKCAYSDEDVLSFVSATEVDRIHLLGGGIKRLEKVCQEIEKISPTTMVQGDSNRLRAWIGKRRPMQREIELFSALMEPRAAKECAISRRVRSESGDDLLEAIFAGLLPV